MGLAELILKNVDFSYGKTKVLQDINIVLENGVTALLGPNGAGKTTLINIIMALYKPDRGEVIYDNHNVRKLKESYYDYIGYLPQMPQFYKNFSAAQFLEYMGTLKGIEKKELKNKINELLILVNLREEKNKKIGAFSGGMRQRLGIAQALLNDPHILILDEPTAGLDPNERIRFRNIISQIGSSKIVILATHIVSDVECIASKAIFIKDKHAVLINNLSDLPGKMQTNVWITQVEDESKIEEYIVRYMVSNIRMVEDNKKYELKIISDEKPDDNAVMSLPGLEDAFLYYYGE